MESFDHAPLAFTEWIDGTCPVAAPNTGLGSLAATAGSFPLLLFAYNDLLDLPDAITSVIASRGDAIAVFVPQFCLRVVAKEIVRSIDTWCSPVSVTASPTSSSSSAPLGASHMFHIWGQGGSNTSIESAMSNDKGYANTRTWCYHALMGMAARLQEECSAPIILYM